MKTTLIALGLLVSLQVVAAERTPPAEELKQRLSGKVFALKWEGANHWRLDLRDNGYFYYNAGESKVTGTWRVEDGKLCLESRAAGNNCNDVREQDGVFFYKRLTGQVTALEPQ